MTRILIVNADDYGRTPGVSAGIRQAHLEGIVTTTTVLMNAPGAADEVQRAMSETPRLGLGVHLNLTAGPPCAPRVGSTLVDDNGLLRRPESLMAHPDSIDLADVEREWHAQIETFLATGARIDHLDSHHHVAAIRLDIWMLYLSLAAEFGCGVRPSRPADANPEDLAATYPEPVRRVAFELAPRRLEEAHIHYPAHFFASFFGPAATLDHLLALLAQLPEGVSELMTHPGHADPALHAGSSYAMEREAELAALTSPRARQAVQREGIMLATYRTAWPSP